MPQGFGYNSMDLGTTKEPRMALEEQICPSALCQLYSKEQWYNPHAHWGHFKPTEKEAKGIWKNQNMQK